MARPHRRDSYIFLVRYGTNILVVVRGVHQTILSAFHPLFRIVTVGRAPSICQKDPLANCQPTKPARWQNRRTGTAVRRRVVFLMGKFDGRRRGISIVAIKRLNDQLHRWSAQVGSGQAAADKPLLSSFGPSDPQLAKACRKNYALQNPDSCGPPVFAGSDG
jgi:hypothetical protein